MGWSEWVDSDVHDVGVGDLDDLPLDEADETVYRTTNWAWGASGYMQVGVFDDDPPDDDETGFTVAYGRIRTDPQFGPCDLSSLVWDSDGADGNTIGWLSQHIFPLGTFGRRTAVGSMAKVFDLQGWQGWRPSVPPVLPPDAAPNPGGPDWEYETGQGSIITGGFLAANPSDNVTGFSITWDGSQYVDTGGAPYVQEVTVYHTSLDYPIAPNPGDHGPPYGELVDPNNGSDGDVLMTLTQVGESLPAPAVADVSDIASRLVVSGDRRLFRLAYGFPALVSMPTYPGRKTTIYQLFSPNVQPKLRLQPPRYRYWRRQVGSWPLRQSQRAPRGLLARQGDNARWPLRQNQRRW